MRSLAAQTVDELGGRHSVLARQRRDHIELDGLLDRATSTSGADQEEALNRICRLALSHAFAEETVLWPAIRRVLPDGEELTLRIEQEHQEINELLARLESTPHPDPERPALVQRAVALLRQDVRDEEDVVLPRLQDAVDRPTLQRLGWYWEAVRRTAPTRPHPTVARRPPGNALSALPLSVLDRARDLLDAGARRTSPPVAQASARVSRALATAAGAVERLGPAQRGEHPSTRPGGTSSA